MKRRDALLGIPAFFGALLLRRKPNPKPIEFEVSGLKILGSESVTAVASGERGGWNLHDPVEREAFQSFLRFVCGNKDVAVKVL